MFELSIARLRCLNTKEIGAEIFEELQNMVLGEYGEDKMARENTNGVIERRGKKWTFLNNTLLRKSIGLDIS